jgi:hypothetical protein
VRAPSEKVASELSAAIGSQFNMRLARALRAQAVVFVEGADMRLIRNLAVTLDAPKLASEVGVVSVPLQGFSNWEHVEPFAWLVNNLLEQTVHVMVILDRDYRTTDQVGALERRLRAIGVRPHVWRRKELESYFLIPAAIARRSGASRSAIRDEIRRLATQKRGRVFARFLAERHATEITRERDATAVTEAAESAFDELWVHVETRIAMCNAKEIFAGVNRWLQARGHRTVSARLLSSSLREHEILDEMVQVIREAEQLVQ